MSSLNSTTRRRVLRGMMAGGAFAAFQEFRERTFRLESDVRSILGHRSFGYVPLIGPRQPTTTDRVRAHLIKGKTPLPTTQAAVPFERVSRIVLDAPRSSFAETFRNAKLACDRMLHGNGSRVIGIVSAVPDEGKSIIAANFAALLAASGKKTLLIDADTPAFLKAAFIAGASNCTQRTDDFVSGSRTHTSTLAVCFFVAAVAPATAAVAIARHRPATTRVLRESLLTCHSSLCFSHLRFETPDDASWTGCGEAVRWGVVPALTRPSPAAKAA